MPESPPTKPFENPAPGTPPFPHGKHPSAGLFRRSMNASLFIGALGTLFAAVYAGHEVAGRYLLFLVWMLANLLLWTAALRELFGRRRAWFLILFGAAKILWIAALVGCCAWIGIRGWANFLSFLLGLNTPFLVMFLKALGASITQGSGSSDHAFKTLKETKEPETHSD